MAEKSGHSRRVENQGECPNEPKTKTNIYRRAKIRGSVVLLRYEARIKVADNPHCPMELLQQLAQDEDSSVRRAVIKHPNCPTQLSQSIKQSILLSYLEQFTKSSIPTYARLIAFRSPHCPTGALAKNYRSRDWLERCVIAENPKIPDATLQKLLLDGNRLVQQKAQANLEQRQTTTPED